MCRILLFVGVYGMAGMYVNVNKFQFFFSVLCSIYVVCNNVLRSGIGLELCTAIEVFSHTNNLNARLASDICLYRVGWSFCYYCTKEVRIF
jgi:hypothetical protein